MDSRIGSASAAQPSFPRARTGHRVAALGLALLAWLPGLCAAQAFPSRPVTLIHGFPPGTILDAVSRPVSVEMARLLGQPVLLDFKPGGNGIVGGRTVIGARPDGHTLYYGNSTSFHPLFVAENAIFAGRDMAPVSTVATVPYFFFSSAKVPARNFQELVAYSKSGPDRVKHGATSATLDLIMKILQDRNGLISRGIPYKSTGQMVTALITNEVETTIGAVQPFIPHLKSGTIRALFIAARARSAQFPDVPTAAEAGIQDFEVTYSYGLWAPPGTPAEVVQKLAAAAAAAVRVPAVGEQIRAMGADPVGSTPQEALQNFERETKFWTEAARLSNFKPQ